jgi:hypothetical protein
MQGRPSQSQQQRPVPMTSSTSSTSQLFFLILLFFILIMLGTRKSQQAQTLRLKQEKFHKLAVKAKQQGMPNTILI